LEIDGEGPGGETRETPPRPTVRLALGQRSTVVQLRTLPRKDRPDCNSVLGLADFATSEHRYCTAVTQFAHGPCGNVSMNAAICGDISARFPHRVHHAVARM